MTQSFANAEQGRHAIDQAIASQNLNACSGFLEVAGRHFHVHATMEGPLISLLEWRTNKNKDEHVRPTLNAYVIDRSTHDTVLSAWHAKEWRQDSDHEHTSTPRARSGRMM